MIILSSEPWLVFYLLLQLLYIIRISDTYLMALFPASEWYSP